MLQDIDKVKKEIQGSFVISILLIIFAILLSTNKEDFINIAIKVFGYLSILVGVLQVFTYIRQNEEKRKNNRYLMNGIILTFYGIIAIIKAYLLNEVITILLGGYFILKNSSRCQLAIEIKPEKENLWKYIFMFAILNIILSMLLIIDPFTNIAVNLYISLTIIIEEIIYVVSSFLLLFNLKKTKKFVIFCKL